MVLACIGEQFQDECYTNDEVTGISVSVRERNRFRNLFREPLLLIKFISLVLIAVRYFKTDKREDLVQIWNSNSQHADKATIIQKVKKLVPHVQFLAVFYKGKLFMLAYADRCKDIDLRWDDKVECVFPMVIWSVFCTVQYRNNSHREDSAHFTGQAVG